MRLSTATLDRVPRDIARFAYDRDRQGVGIVHFGIGAFHRAHQAWFTDRAMDAGDRDWAITGVSMRSDSVARQLNPQDGLYSITERFAAGHSTRVVGAVRNVLVARSEREAVVAAIADAGTRIVSFTVTEKGYCRGTQGDLDLAAAADGFYPLLAAGLQRRRNAGLPGVTLLSCDNLANNGEALGRLVTAYLESAAPGLTDWFASDCSCPSSMIDRIVPMTSPDDLATVATALGVEDQGAVVTEPFAQWVIEDRFAAGRPDWGGVGAQMVSDVRPYETAKLRMLNGAHSALAYLGLERGHDFVHQAMGDPVVRATVETLMRDEAAASFAPASGQDLTHYADSLLDRFANPALHHRLAQIAMDGSQKIPQRWLETVVDRRATGRESPAILTALAAWTRYVRGDRFTVDDPLAAPLAGAWRKHGDDGIVDALFADGGLIQIGLEDADRIDLRQRLHATG